MGGAKPKRPAIDDAGVLYRPSLKPMPPARAERPSRRTLMARVVRAALLQAEDRDKESMIEKHEKYAREAAAQGAKVMCFQELFYGPYFCQVQDPQYFSYTEHIPDGPTTKRMQELAKETGMVLIVPMYEEDDQTTGIYNTAAVIDADAPTCKYRKTHIPHVKGFWEKYYFRPGNMGYPVFDTAVGKVGVYICYDRHFPRARAGARPERGGARLHPVGHLARALRVPLARRAGQPRPRQRILRRHDQPRRRRAAGRRRLLRPVVLRRPRGQFIGDVGDPHDEELIVRDLDLDKIEEVRQTWQFFRDRRPDAYDDLVRP